MLARDGFFSDGVESLQMLTAVGDVLEVGIVALDRDLVIRGWSTWLAKASGHDAASVVGQPLLDLYPELRGSAAEAALQTALSGGTTMWAHRFHRHFLPLPPSPGTGAFALMQQSARILPLMQADEVRGAILIITDVTERVAREGELNVALKNAEVASQAKSDFLASMSHELRTPLGAIVGYMDLLESEMVGTVEPLQKNYFGRVKTAAWHLISIIEEILTFSRVEAGKESVLMETVDAGELARSVEELFEPQALRKGLALSISLPDESLRLSTDATKLRQILINLIGNAMKFTDAGAVSLEMQVEADRAIFCIRDTGPGINAGDLDRIFDPFTQLDQSLRRTKGGTGLGLPVSRKLAHLLGGDLTVESSRAGTAFTLWLPLAAPTA